METKLIIDSRWEIVYWVTTIVSVVGIAGTGLLDLTGAPGMAQHVTALGYLRKAASASVNRHRLRLSTWFATEQRFRRTQRRFTVWDHQSLRRLVSLVHIQWRQGLLIMNRLIWLVGAVVIVLFVLGYFGLR